MRFDVILNVPNFVLNLVQLDKGHASIQMLSITPGIVSDNFFLTPPAERARIIDRIGFPLEELAKQFRRELRQNFIDRHFPQRITHKWQVRDPKYCFQRMTFSRRLPDVSNLFYEFNGDRNLIYLKRF